MKAWIIEGPTGALLPSACGRTRAEAINNCLGWCDWILFPTWKAMRKDGFKAVKVEIKKLPSNVKSERAEPLLAQVGSTDGLGG